MKLYGSPVSPFVRKARIVVAELGLSERVAFVLAEGTPVDADPGLRIKNPLRRIPFLELDDGSVVYDSRVAVEAMIQAARPQSLLPEDGPERIETLTRQALADGICDSAVGAAYEMRLRPAEKVWDVWVAQHWAKVESGLDAFEAAERPEGRFDLGDCALAALPAYLDLRFSDRPWRETRPKLAAWWETERMRPSVAATL